MVGEAWRHHKLLHGPVCSLSMTCTSYVYKVAFGLQLCLFSFYATLVCLPITFLLSRLCFGYIISVIPLDTPGLQR